MSTYITVAEAERQLAAARAEAAKLERENALQELAVQGQEGAALVEELTPLATKINTLQNKRLELYGLLLQARNQIAVFSQPLDPLTFPSTKQIAKHDEQLRSWKQRQKELQRESMKVSEEEWSARQRALLLVAKLTHLKFVTSNLSAIASGLRPGQIEGGLFLVGEDLLGHSDRRYD